MISFKEFLIEIFDKPVKYQKIDDKRYRFNIDNERYEVFILRSPKLTGGYLFDIVLSCFSNDKRGVSEYSLTGINNPIPVLSTCKRILDDYFSTRHLLKDDVIKFDTFDIKARKLYTRLAYYLANKLKCDVNIEEYGKYKVIFTITKR